MCKLCIPHIRYFCFNFAIKYEIFKETKRLAFLKWKDL